MNQTPGQWTIAVTAHVLCEPCMADITDDKGAEVATGVRYKHAVHVLRCVNAHDGLVQALELAHKLLNGLLTDNQLDFVQPDGSTARGKLASIRQALAMARGQG